MIGSLCKIPASKSDLQIKISRKSYYAPKMCLSGRHYPFLRLKKFGMCELLPDNQAVDVWSDIPILDDNASV